MDRTRKSNNSDMTYEPDQTNRTVEKGATRIFAVTGNPVLHSKSPDIFNAAFRELSLDAVYTRFAASNAEGIVKGILDTGISGLNITSPFKEDIVPYLDTMDESAQRIGAVNTVVVDNGRLYGFNTDIKGVKDALSSNGVKVKGKKAVVLGAGGAAKAAICALISDGADATIINRTFEKAKKISDNSGCKIAKFEEINETVRDADIVVSCLSSFKRVINPDFLNKNMSILDANYGVKTALVKDGMERNCAIIDGREWLLFQGMEAFRHFLRIEPPLNAMKEAVYRQNTLQRNNISFIGFMASGKSIIGQNSANLLSMSYRDIDKVIEKKTNASISEIFENQGEETFRRIEKEAIADIRVLSNTIISCGGGAILDSDNRKVLRENSIVIWLWANIDTVLKRIGDDKSRPLLQNEDQKLNIKKILDTRIPLYACASDMIVNTEGLEPDEIIRKIYEETGKFLKN